ncbi:hypothetical protein SynSYN20_01918 [Synechococcus sp. SYN20]|nr:hypothetical protein SynSYN20_01918 [Synechococcus sp. SYN20]
MEREQDRRNLPVEADSGNTNRQLRDSDLHLKLDQRGGG